MTTPASNVWMGLMLRAWTQQMRNRVHQSVRGSKLMVSVIVTFMIGYWIFFTDLFWEGIHFLMGIPAIGEILLNRMFYLLFAFLMSMLVSSCVIVGYTTFFKNRETQWMLTLPIPHQDVFRWKFLETTVLASWAFLFLSGPLLLAYALYLRLGWGFLLGVGFIYFPFALICSVMGTWILLFVVRMFHHRSGRKALFALAVALLAATIWTFKPVDVEQLHEIQLTPLLNMLMKNSRHVAQPFLPSYWLGASILSLSSHLWAKLIFFMLVTLSHCLLAMWSIWFLTGKLFYLNSSLVVDRVLHGSTVSRKPRAFAEWTGKLLLAFIPGVRKQVRAIL
ncbi:MAG: hypothetical protein JO317_00955, partial [Verrucomicrobiae bacterium]|nr:hypothetical protein [Verrucomicrobiae bacterium]